MIFQGDNRFSLRAHALTTDSPNGDLSAISHIIRRYRTTNNGFWRDSEHKASQCRATLNAENNVFYQCIIGYLGSAPCQCPATGAKRRCRAKGGYASSAPRRMTSEPPALRRWHHSVGSSRAVASNRTAGVMLPLMIKLKTSDATNPRSRIPCAGIAPC